MNRSKRPIINDTSFGSITVDGVSYDHDIIIALEGRVKKRKKKLSKSIYGTSHTISLPEIQYIYQKNAAGIIIGSGQYGVTRLSKEAAEFIERKECRAVLKKTADALEFWNHATGAWIGLFHVTC